jgi:Xaa-Pro aminopeptidase
MRRKEVSLMFTLSLEERDRRWKMVRKTMEERGIDCLIVFGINGFNRNLAANLRYLSNVVVTEGYFVFPLQREPTLITFFGRLDTPWVTDARAGHPSYSKVISDRLRELGLEGATIGIVGLSGFFGELGFPHTTFTSLAGNFPKANLKDATDIVEEARRMKSAVEIRCFELGCEAGEKAIQAAVDTAKVGVRDREVQAEIMDTLFRNYCDPGSMLLYCSGKEVSHAGQGHDNPDLGPRPLEQGDVILTEFDARFLGYIAQFNQPFSVGEPNHEWRKILSVALEAFDNGLNTLRPGITVGELDQAVLSTIKGAGYVHRNPAFHGLGLSLEGPIGSFPVQSPYKPFTSLRFQAGMVLEIEPHVVTPDGKKGLTIGCPILVTETGCRILSKNWKPGFKIV